MLPNEYLGENSSNQITTSQPATTLSVSIDDEYSTSDSNDSSHQQRSYPSIEV